MVILVMLIVVLLPQAVCDAQIVNCEIRHPKLVHHKYCQPGDLIIGAIVFQNKFLNNTSTFNQSPPQPLLHSIFIQNYQPVLALEFAVKEINENRQLLPNVTLGFSIYDSYSKARWANRAMLQLISPNIAPNYKCAIQGNLMAVTEELSSDFSHQLPDLLGLYKIPQMLYGSAANLMDKNQALSVFWVEPNGVRQYKGILQLLLHFKWTWVGLIAANDRNLQWFVDIMFQEFLRSGICFAILESFSSVVHDKSEMKFYDKIMNHSANVLVIYGDIRSMLWLRWILNIKRRGTHHKPRGQVWILTTQMELRYFAGHDDWDNKDFHGTLSFVTHSHELQGFQPFLQSRNLHSNKEDGFLKDFWENAFQCSFSSSPSGNKERNICTGQEKLESLPEYIYPMSTTGQSYTLYNAVYAVAHALHAMFGSNSKNRVKIKGEKMKLQNQQPWQLHHFLKMVSFNNSGGDLISFDQNGEIVAGFDIINWVTFPNQSVSKVKVGRLEPQAPPTEVITIEEGAIVWHSWFNKLQPVSVCNDNCYPGYRKKKKEGEPFCCYDCIPCPEGKVSDQKDMADCFTCPSDQCPNQEQTSCIPKVVIFLSYEDTLGVGLAICALSFVMITALVLGLFMKHHNSPIVKVNNQSLTYTILISLLLCFLCPLLHIGRPGKVICVLQQTACSIVFTMTMSAVLAKTVTVVLAFRATQPGSTMKSWLGKRLASSIILPCVIMEAIISVVRLAVYSQFPHTDMHSSNDGIILDCNESSSAKLFIGMTFLGFLVTVNFTVAFFARKLPDAVNEAKFITFSMIACSCVWLPFIQTFLTSIGKRATAMHIFCVLASSAALLAFMFFPKCYIILWRPQLNSREQLRKWKC